MTPSSPRDAHGLAALFREQSGRLVAFLARILGMHRVDVAEDLAQETLLVALQAWSGALPPDPTAWLFVVAKNRALDVLRRERVRRGQGTVDADEAQLLAADPDDSDRDLLRLMFSCCHPALTEDTQAALVLRLVCGFGTAEVAHAFLTAPAAMEKRLVRARKVLAGEGRLFDVDAVGEARARCPAVMTALYLMFDAGYHGSAEIRADVCEQAIRLALLLAESPATAQPAAHALVALLCLHAARMPARLADPSLVPLDLQDRAAWDARLIALGMEHLAASAEGTALTPYHLEAGIAAEHAMAPSLEATRWERIAPLYDRLYAQKPTPIVALSRAIARGHLAGFARGLEELRALEGRERLATYPFYWAALGDFARRAGERAAARAYFERGAACSRNDVERAMFDRLLAALGHDA